MKAAKYINPMLFSGLLLILAVSCAGNRRQDGTNSPFVEEELPELKQNMVRAEGSGTSPDVHMATEIARINAMTVLAGKISPADTLSETGADGTVRITESVAVPVFDVTEVDRQVFKNRTTDDYTVWILLEAEIVP